jgi:DNA-binding transcriptional regulator YiaG
LAFSPTVLPTYTIQIDHDGRKYEISVADLSVLRCSECGDIQLDDAADERINEALRAKIGLLTPQQIRQGREGLNLTQKDLAASMRLSESTLSRWETGAQIQQRCMDAFLRCFFAIEEVRKLLSAPPQIWCGLGGVESVSWTAILEDAGLAQTTLGGDSSEPVAARMGPASQVSWEGPAKGTKEERLEAPSVDGPSKAIP